MRRPATASALIAIALAGCGGREPLPRSCAEARPADVVHALRTAPDGVALVDGTRLSTCVARAIGDAELQIVGATLTDAADRLARRMAGSEAAAFRLGFLMGAAQRGAAQTTGVQSELADRIGQAAGFDGGGAGRRTALLRGMAAGRSAG